MKAQHVQSASGTDLFVAGGKFLDFLKSICYIRDVV